MSYKIFKISEVDLQNIIYTHPFQQDGSTVIRMYFKPENTTQKNIPILIEIPELLLCDNYDGGDNIILPLYSLNDDKTNDVVNFFNALDNQIISDLKTNVKKWCPKLKNMSYKAVVNEADDIEIFKNGAIKFRINESEFKTSFYDKQRNVIETSQLNKALTQGNYLKSIIELKAIHVNPNNDIALIFRTHQIKVIPPNYEKINLNSYSFYDSDNDDNKEYSASKAKKIIKNTLLKNKKKVAENSDNETETVQQLAKLVSDDEDDDDDTSEEEVEEAEEVDNENEEDDSADDDDDDSDEESDDEEEEEGDDNDLIDDEAMIEYEDDDSDSESSTEDARVKSMFKKRK